MAAHEMETLQVPFTGGIDQRTEPEFLDPNSRMLDVVNGVWAKEGGVRKRFGITSQAIGQLSGDPAMNAPLRLITKGNELLRIDGESANSYVPAAGLWAKRSLVPPVYATRQHLYTATSALWDFSVTEGNGFRAFIYRDIQGVAGDVYVSVYDLSTGAALFQNFRLTTGNGTSENPIGYIIGTHLFVTWVNNPPTVLSGRVLDLNSMTWGGTTSIVTDINQSAYDATPYVGATGLLIMYAFTDGGGFPQVKYIRLESLPALTVTASAVLTTNSTDGGVIYPAMCCRHDAASSNRAWFFWEKETTGPVYTFAATALNAGTWAVVGTPQLAVTYTGYIANQLIAGLGIEILGSNLVIYTFMPVEPSPAGLFASHTVHSTTARIGGAAYPSGQFAGRPFLATINGTTRCYVPFAMFEQIVPNGPYATTFFLMDTHATDGGGLPRVVATIAPRQGNEAYIAESIPGDNRPAYLTNTGNPSASTYALPILLNGPYEYANEAPFTIGNPPAATFVDLAIFDFTGALAWQHAEGSAETVLACGAPSFYDGLGVQELGFFAWPTTSAAPTVVTPGGNIAAGQYGYAIIFSEIDAAGLVHRSAAWTQTVTIPSNSSFVTWSINNIPYTNRYVVGRLPLIEIYRTANNGATYTFVGAVSCNSANNTTPINFTDTLADATIASNALLYTSGGVLDSICPPSFRVCIRHGARFWGIDDSGYVLWYSTQFNGADFPYFNEGLTLVMYDGPLTALAELDDKLIVFSATRLWLLTGDGPAVTGQGSDLSSAINIPSDVGATDWRSVVSFPGGILFQAPSGGIYMLGRDLAVRFAGKVVQDATTGKKVVAAHLIASEECIRFLLSDSSTLVYDYVFDRWSRGTYPYPLTVATIAAGTTWTAGTSDNNVYQENTAASVKPYYDTSGVLTTWVTVTLTAGPLKGLGLQSWLQWGAIQGFAPWLDPCDITMTLNYDGGRASQSHTYPHATLFAANSLQAAWLMMPQAANAAGQSLQVVLSDAPASDSTSVSGQGVRWLGFAADLTALGMRNLNLPASVRA